MGHERRNIRDETVGKKQEGRRKNINIEEE
jgi:hypothetical protein